MDFDGTLANVHTSKTLEQLSTYRQQRFGIKCTAGNVTLPVLWQQQPQWEQAEIAVYAAVLKALGGTSAVA